MQVLTNSEVRQIVVELQTLVGAQLQEVGQEGDQFYLGFYHQRQMIYVWFDLNPRSPCVARFFTKPLRKLKAVKPLLQFARAHFVGHRLMSVHTLPSWGRVLQMRFHSPENFGLQFEARLFPHGQNLIFTKTEENKKGKLKVQPVSLLPVVQLEQAPEIDRNEDWQSNLEPRTWETITDDYVSGQKPLVKPAMRPASSSDYEGGDNGSLAGPTTEMAKEERAFVKLLKKKQQAIAKMQADLLQKKNARYQEAAAWLTQHLHLSVAQRLEIQIPTEFEEHLQPKKSWNDSAQILFAKAKLQKTKQAAAEARLQLVEKELQALENQGWQSWARKSSQKKSGQAQNQNASTNLLHKAEGRGRTWKYSAQIEVYVGRNAQENLKLLRAAQPFDYWLHLRDSPASHAIVRRPRGVDLNDKQIQEIGCWVIEQSLRRTQAELRGEVHELILVECRFVRPIKGDKAGRVTYTNDRNVRVKIP